MEYVDEQKIVSEINTTRKPRKQKIFMKKKLSVGT